MARRLVKRMIAASAGVALALGGTLAVAAPSAAAELKCTPNSTAGQVGGLATASGSAACTFYPSEVAVTVILYVDGWNEGSSYRTCASVTECVGTPVSLPTSSPNVCGRTVISWDTPNGRETRATSTGTSCPL
jgi:hypothetical protein